MADETPTPAEWHRYEARGWLAEASTALAESSDHAPHAQAAATIAVGHALLALAGQEDTDA